MNNANFHDFAKFLTKIKKIQEIEILLKDLLTPQEIKKILERLQIIKMLAQGISQRTIKEKLKVSIALVTRGSHALQKNNGGFPIYLKQFSKKSHE